MDEAEMSLRNLSFPGVLALTVALSACATSAGPSDGGDADADNPWIRCHGSPDMGPPGSVVIRWAGGADAGAPYAATLLDQHLTCVYDGDADVLFHDDYLVCRGPEG